MKKSRIKLKPLPIPTTRDEAESLMTDLAHTVNNHRALASNRDADLLRLNESYAPDLTHCEQTIQQYTETLRAWAEANPSEFPKDRKSITMLSGTLGFRTGTPKLDLLNRRWTWKKALEAVLSLFPGYVRTKPEIDKDKIIADYHAKLIHDLHLAGLHVTQDESFFIEPDLTNIL